MLYPCILCVVLLMDLSCVMPVCELFGETIRHNYYVHLTFPSIGFVYVFVCRKLCPYSRV